MSNEAVKSVQALADRVTGQLKARREKSLEYAQNAARVLGKRVEEISDRLKRDTLEAPDPDLVNMALDLHASLVNLALHRQEALRVKELTGGLLQEAASFRAPATEDDVVVPEEEDSEDVAPGGGDPEGAGEGGKSEDLTPEQEAERQAGDGEDSATDPPKGGDAKKPDEDKGKEGEKAKDPQKGDAGGKGEDPKKDGDKK